MRTTKHTLLAGCLLLAAPVAASPPQAVAPRAWAGKVLVLRAKRVDAAAEPTPEGDQVLQFGHRLSASTDGPE